MTAPIRLDREAPAARQAGRATSIGVFLTLVGSVMIMLAMRSNAPRADANEWLVYVIAGGFSAVGVVVTILGIRMFLATRLPETIVEVDTTPVRAGNAFQVTVRQPGPIRLKSLRLNLVAEQLTTRDVWRNGRRRRETDRRLIHQDNVLDLGEISILAGEEIARGGEAKVPAEVNLAEVEGVKRVVWRLEVWGRVRGWMDLGHPFVIEVVGGKSRSTLENAGASARTGS